MGGKAVKVGNSVVDDVLDVGKIVSKEKNFASGAKLSEHYLKHGVEMGFKSEEAYLEGARYTIKNGKKISYLYKGKKTIGYAKFWANGSNGANFAFVGMNGGKIATFGIRSLEKLRKMDVIGLY